MSGTGASVTDAPPVGKTESRDHFAAVRSVTRAGTIEAPAADEAPATGEGAGPIPRRRPGR
tara:strand:+ start:7752 stop:7934 length:183 start_codon:yes stop_codon:yes gene_type:complete